MAGRILNRRELRDQADQATRQQAAVEAPAEGVAVDPKEARKAKAKAKRAASPPKPRKPRAKKAPPRLCARWGVFDGGMKQIAIFDYNQRAAAETKLAEMLGRQKGTYFMQIVKEPMPEPAPEEVPAAE
jgi:hypothetical protein